VRSTILCLCTGRETVFQLPRTAKTEALLREAGHPDLVAATRVLMALRTGYVYSLGLEEDTGWAETFLAAFDRVINER
jgi:hypothetical protein